jgi:predicted RNase H-like HicB family nuclease
MKVFTAVIEKDLDTNLYLGYVPSFVGAHSQGETLDELCKNLHEVIAMLLEDDVIPPQSKFIGTQLIAVP